MHKKQSFKHLYPDDDGTSASRTTTNTQFRKNNKISIAIIALLLFSGITSAAAKQQQQQSNTKSIYNKYYRSHIAPSLSCDFENNQNAPYKWLKTKNSKNITEFWTYFSDFRTLFIVLTIKSKLMMQTGQKKLSRMKPKNQATTVF